MAIAAANRPAPSGAPIPAMFKRLATIHSVPPRILLLTAAASYVAQMTAIVQGWPLWGIALATLVPWIPVVTFEIRWTYSHFQWLALLYVLAITQAGHVAEHLTQMVQLHLLQLPASESKGIFGALDTEWVHVTWNTWILIAVAILLMKFRRNPWLWTTVAIAGWHELEHLYIMTQFLPTGRAGTPGLLARGGLIGGGVPLGRPDLHFLYNVVETIPIFAALVWQVRHSYDEWLARALPTLSRRELEDTTNLLQTRSFAPGQAVVRQGDPADAFYVITKGEAEVIREDELGRRHHVATLRPGQFFGEIGLLARSPRTATVRASTALDVLALGRDDFGRLVHQSQSTHRELTQVMQERVAAQNGT